MNKIIFGLKLIFVGIVGLVSGWFRPHLLGTITTTAGDSYPTSSYTFNDNDVINAGDLNLITTYTGIRGSTDTISLQGQIYNTSSSLFGLYGSTTSTVQTAHGGSGAGSFTYGVLVGSSSNAFTTIAPGSSGNILSSNGSTWSSSALSSSTWNRQTFTSSASWTVPAGINTIYLTMVGGGGGGSGECTGSITGGSGGSAGVTLRYPTSTTPGNTLSVIVGAGGNGGQGSTSTPSNLCTSVLAGASGTASTITGSGVSAGGGGASNASGTAGTGGSGFPGGFPSGNVPNGITGSGTGGGGVGANGVNSFMGLGGSGGLGQANCNVGGGQGATSTAGYGGSGGGGGGTAGGCNGGGGGPGIVIIEY